MNRFVKEVFFASVGIVVMLACVCAIDPSRATERQSSETQSLPQQRTIPGGEPKSPPDLSLTPEQYIKLGLPAYDRPWSGTDMASAAKVLAALASKDPGQLPRYQSPRSGKVFSRLVATPQNQELSRNKSLPLQSRLQNALGDLQATSEIMKLYLASFLNGKTSGADLIELFGGSLRSTVVAVEVFDEFIPTLKDTDPTYKARMAGVEQMKKGLAMTVSGSFDSLTEAFDKADRLRLLEHMQETLPAIVPRLSPASRQEVSVRLDKMLSNTTLEEFHPGLKKLQDKLAAPPDKNKAP